jgi:hypothetical protein
MKINDEGYSFREKRDAVRYRWFRNWWLDDIALPRSLMAAKSAADVDAAIDASIAASGLSATARSDGKDDPVAS